jgi:uncharacterized protein (DUF1778 family)
MRLPDPRGAATTSIHGPAFWRMKRHRQALPLVGLLAKWLPPSFSLALAIEAEWRKHVAGVVPAQPRARAEGNAKADFERIDIVDTMPHFYVMSKARATSSQLRPSAASRPVAARRMATDTKGSINLRIEAATRQLIDDAAATVGKTRTEFMIDSARRDAVDVLLDRRLFVLDSSSYDSFVAALDNPPAPGPKLKALMRRVPAWRK